MWRQEVGIGHSSPVASGDRVYVFSRRGEQEVIAAYTLGHGRPLWQQAYDAPYTMNPAATAHGKGPKSTPVLHRATLCAFGIAGMLTCVDAGTGTVRWQQDFTRQYRETSPLYGTAMSPLVDGELMVVHAGGPGNGALTAFDIGTGRVRWRWAGDGPAYASPVTATIAGTRQIVTQSERHLIGVSAADGSLLWRVPFTTEYDQNAVTPIVRGDVVIYSGLARGLTAVRVVRDGTGWRTERLWQNDSVPAYMSTPVAAGPDRGLLFGLTHRNRGQLFCVDASTGRTLWTTGGRQADNAALLALPRSILALTTGADLIVFRTTGTTYEEVRRYEVAPSATWAHPALSPAGILIKDESSLALWRVEP